MKTYQQKLNYAELELIYSQPHHCEAKTSTLLLSLKQLFKETEDNFLKLDAR